MVGLLAPRPRRLGQVSCQFCSRAGLETARARIIPAGPLVRHSEIAHRFGSVSPRGIAGAAFAFWRIPMCDIYIGLIHPWGGRSLQLLAPFHPAIAWVQAPDRPIKSRKVNLPLSYDRGGDYVVIQARFP